MDIGNGCANPHNRRWLLAAANIAISPASSQKADKPFG
jgi:hypothetical protein